MNIGILKYAKLVLKIERGGSAILSYIILRSIRSIFLKIFRNFKNQISIL